MSTSTLSTTDTPLFRGRPPLLVAPAVMVLVLWAKLYPRKHITGKCEEIDAWARPVAQFPLPTLNLCLTIWLYTYSNLDGWPPLAVETPASAESHEATVCQILVASAAFVLTLAQIMSIPVHVKAAWGTQAITKWFWPVMIWPAINGFVIGWWILFGQGSPDQTFLQFLEEKLLRSEICMLIYDLLIVAAYYRMHKAADGGMKALLHQLLSVACLPLTASLALMGLRNLVFFLGMPRHGWLGSTLHILGYLTAAHMHMAGCYLMWTEVAKHSDAQSVKGRMTAESADLLEIGTPAAMDV